MSSRNSKEHILDAAVALIKRREGADVSMSQIAEAARVSRQAVYLHFADRGDLMLALVRHAHEKFGAAERLRKVEGAPTGVGALRVWVALQAQMNPNVWSVARALEVVRRTDEAAERGWQDRQKHRLEQCRQIVARMHQEGALKPGITREVAADLLWSITSLRTWEELVLERGWTATQYRERTIKMLCNALMKTAK